MNGAEFSSPFARRTILVFVVVCLSVLVVGLKFGPASIVGDEMEYFAMAYGIAHHGTPELRPDVLAAVHATFPGRGPYDPRPMPTVMGTFHALHFWFLSLLASPFLLLCEALGVRWAHCFAFIDAAFFGVAIAFAYGYFRLGGAAIIAACALSSPFTGYLNRAHPEAYSVSLFIAAACAIAGGELIAGAVIVALISLQVSAFSPLAVAVIGYRIWLSRKVSMRRAEWAGAALSVVLLAIQPLWTMWRFRTFNLIYSRGFVVPEMATPKRLASILVDPDVGLYLNWPLGIGLTLLIASAWFWSRDSFRRYRAFWLFFPLSVLLLSWAGAQQANFTTGVSRYALWYIPLFAVAAAILIQSAFEKYGRGLRASALAAAFSMLAMAAAYYNVQITGLRPQLAHKPLADLWYRYLPGLWDPDEQVFSDITLNSQRTDAYDLFFTRRYPAAALPDPALWAMSNQSCTKLLVLGPGFTSSNVSDLAPFGCERQVDPVKLLAYVRNSGYRGLEDRYVNVRLGDLESLRPAQGASAHAAVQTSPAAAKPMPAPSVRTQSSAGMLDFHIEFPGIAISDMTRIWVLIGQNLSVSHACYVTYDPVASMIYLTPDDGDGAKASRVRLGTNAVLKNRQCEISGRDSKAEAEGSKVRLTLRLRRRSGFVGAQRIWISGQTSDRQASPWAEAGQW